MSFANPRPRVAILVGSKGRGSNMACLIAGCQSGDVPAEAALVVTPRAGNPASLRAQECGVPVRELPPKGEAYADRLLALLRDERIDIVCLAGFMNLLPSEVVRAYEGRMLNIHPALLPKFGGKGMYGHHVHEAVIAAGETESGPTVHFVAERFDEGPILLQLKCPVLPDDTPESLAERVLELEHKAYPEALKRLIASHA